MKTVRDNRMYRASGMNEYARSGKMPKELLDYFKSKGQEAQRKYQGSGYNPSLLQRAYDEASQIGMGLLNLFETGMGGDPYLSDDFMRGYQREESADRERAAEGRAGVVDKLGAAISSGLGELGRDMSTLPSSVEKDIIGAAMRGAEHAGLSDEERRRLRAAQDIKNLSRFADEGDIAMAGRRGNMTSEDLLRVLGNR